ncbi:MAG: molybdenum cofactor guanylyltransferase [Hyphomonadaceae bacterium]|nr:molybdenum cofactor guanylyltransferase [Hyphomonadaceae bacterium]
MGESVETASSPCAATEADWGFAPSPIVVALVLAGGEGVRIGGGKPGRLLAGRRLVDHAIQIARRESKTIAIGLRALEQVSAAATHVVLDQPGIDGPMASLAAGLAWAKDCGARFLLTLPCDAPFIPHGLVQRLTQRLEASRATVALPASYGRVHPSCGLWRADVGDRIADYLSSGRRSLQGFAEHVGYVIEDWGAPPRDPFYNINTPEALVAAETWFA